MKKDTPTFIGNLGIEVPEIYLGVDHLKKGNYVIHITDKDKIIRTIEFLKE